MHKVMVKPLSVNRAWQGKRYKTPEYLAYEQECFLKLPRGLQVPSGDLSLFLEFGQSNAAADFDNPVKNFVDILSKAYEFDDRRIVEASIRKRKVAKGSEYVLFSLISASL